MCVALAVMLYNSRQHAGHQWEKHHLLPTATAVHTAAMYALHTSNQCVLQRAWVKPYIYLHDAASCVCVTRTTDSMLAQQATEAGTGRYTLWHYNATHEHKTLLHYHPLILLLHPHVRHGQQYVDPKHCNLMIPKKLDEVAAIITVPLLVCAAQNAQYYPKVNGHPAELRPGDAKGITRSFFRPLYAHIHTSHHSNHQFYGDVSRQAIVMCSVPPSCQHSNAYHAWQPVVIRTHHARPVKQSPQQYAAAEQHSHKRQGKTLQNSSPPASEATEVTAQTSPSTFHLSQSHRGAYCQGNPTSPMMLCTGTSLLC